MKTFRFPHLLATCLAVLALALPAQAEDEKEVELTGTGLCAKCALEETEECTTAIVAEKDGEEVTFYIKKNEVERAFHSKVCQGKHNITAKGTVSEEDGQHYLEATELTVIEEDEEE